MNENNTVELSEPTAKLLRYLAGDNKDDQRAFIARAILGEGLLIEDRNAAKAKK